MDRRENRQTIVTQNVTQSRQYGHCRTYDVLQIITLTSPLTMTPHILNTQYHPCEVRFPLSPHTWSPTAVFSRKAEGHVLEPFGTNVNLPLHRICCCVPGGDRNYYSMRNSSLVILESREGPHLDNFWNTDPHNIPIRPPFAGCGGKPARRFAGEAKCDGIAIACFP